jgi:hypothetical protein
VKLRRSLHVLPHLLRLKLDHKDTM